VGYAIAVLRRRIRVRLMDSAAVGTASAMSARTQLGGLVSVGDVLTPEDHLPRPCYPENYRDHSNARLISDRRRPLRVYLRLADLPP